MSKAFTREDDSEELPPLRPLPSLPPGIKNYITREGANNLRRDLDRLTARRSTAPHDRSSLDQRIAQIQQILSSVTTVEPSDSNSEQVRFGVFVTVKDSTGEIETYRIVGVNEIDLDRNWISWQSPLARALANARLGDTVEFKTPAGVRRLSITAISNTPP